MFRLDAPRATKRPISTSKSFEMDRAHLRLSESTSQTVQRGRVSVGAARRTSSNGPVGSSRRRGTIDLIADAMPRNAHDTHDETAVSQVWQGDVFRSRSDDIPSRSISIVTALVAAASRPSDELRG